MVLREINGFAWHKIVGAENNQKYKSEIDKSRLELFSLCGV